MASNATPARREGLLRATRKVIECNPEVFNKAGKRLGEIYSETYLLKNDDYGKWENKSSVELIFPRLDCARLGAIHDDYPLGISDMRFEEPMPQAERKLAASMVVLTLVLTIDPDANDYISESMCPFAALPWYFGEDVPGLLGRCMFGWKSSENNSVDSPPGEVLDLLERAKWSVSTRDVMPLGMTIPTGDGQPCNEPGTNPYDELRRALDDVCRHVGAFKGSATEWADVTEFEFGDELCAKKREILEFNRTWWASWEPALRRARDASLRINRPELNSYINESLGGLGTLANTFHAPLMGNRGETLGDHLLKRGALCCDKEGQSSYPHEVVVAAYKPIGQLIERLLLYVDGTVMEKADEADRFVPETMAVSIETDSFSNIGGNGTAIELPVQLEYKQAAVLHWLGSPDRRHRVFRRTEIIIDDPGVPTDTKNMRMSINMLHDLGLVDSPPKRSVKITKAGLVWLETQQSTH